MKHHLDSGSHVSMSPEEESDVRQQVLEIFEEADEPDGSLRIDEIYERFIYRRTKQALDAMIRDGLIVRLECGCYGLSSRVRGEDAMNSDCGCNALDTQA